MALEISFMVYTRSERCRLREILVPMQPPSWPPAGISPHEWNMASFENIRSFPAWPIDIIPLLFKVISRFRLFLPLLRTSPPAEQLTPGGDRHRG